MFENPRRGRQASNFTTNVPKILDLKSSSEQIFFRKLSLGAPVNSFSYFSAKQWNALPDFFRTSFFCRLNTDLTQRHFNHLTAVSDHLSLPYHSIKDIELILLELINSDRPAKDF